MLFVKTNKIKDKLTPHSRHSQAIFGQGVIIIVQKILIIQAFLYYCTHTSYNKRKIRHETY